MRKPSISVRRGLRKLGDDLKKARIRRRLTILRLAARAKEHAKYKMCPNPLLPLMA